jgi:hypothetical protein
MLKGVVAGRSSSWLALPVSLAAFFVFAGGASAAVLDVNDNTAGPGPSGADCATPDHSSIQVAVDAASSGDTINVCAGTYSNGGAGTAVVIPDSKDNLTLRGAQAGVDANRTFNAANESTINDDSGAIYLSGTNSGVTIDGFNIVGTTDDNFGAGVFFPGDSSDQTFVNNIVAGNQIGLYPAGQNTGVGEQTLIEDNRFEDNNDGGPSGGSGIYTDFGLSNAVIHDNTFVNNQNSSLNIVNGLDVAESDSNVEVTDNEVINSSGLVFFGINGLDVTGNEITGNTFGSAIYLGAGNNGGNQNVNIAENLIDGNSFTGVRVDNTFFPGTTNSGITVVDNVITGNERGSRITDTSLGGPMEVHRNVIVGNSVAGIANEDVNDQVNAENNWWGCNAGPGSAGCSPNVGTVDSDPRIVLGTSANPTSVNVGGQTSQVSADMSKNSAGAAVPGGVGVLEDRAITFATNLGSVSPPGSTLSNAGQASSQFTSGATAGTANVTATVDNQSVVASITVVDPNAGGVGTGGGDTGGGDAGGGTQQQVGGATEVADTLIGTDADDVINGLAGDDTILGGVGNDLLQGGDGADEVDGGVGDDEVGGGAGPDSVSGGEGNDIVKGGPGPDTLDGGGGEDDISGGRGQDDITANDGEKDTINCGANVDTVKADGKDDVSSNCENVS